MFSLTTIVLSLSLLASQTIAAPNSSRPSRHARWLQTPRTLLDPEFFKRQASTCDPTEVACQGNKCCPAGFNCYYPTATAACCPVGETCTGPPVGCADPNSLECPTNIGGCCPIGQACYLDSGGVARCDNTGLYSNSIVPTVSTPPITINTPTLNPFTTPTFTPVVPTTASTTKAPSGNVAGGGPVTVTVKGGAGKKMAMGLGALAVMMSTLVALA